MKLQPFRSWQSASRAAQVDESGYFQREELFGVTFAVAHSEQGHFCTPGTALAKVGQLHHGCITRPFSRN